MSVRREAGAAAVEFALILPIFLMMIYAMVVYAYMFVLQESMTFAAQSAAEATIKVNPAQAGYSTALVDEARAAASQVLGYLPDAQKLRVLGESGDKVEVTPDLSTSVVTVELTFDFDGLFPVLSLPGLGDVPPMPANLTASAVAGI